MSSPAAPLSGDRESFDQARALRGLLETLKRHPHARIYAQLSRAPRRRTVGDGGPDQSRDDVAAVARPGVRVPGPQPRITDQAIGRRHGLAWFD